MAREARERLLAAGTVALDVQENVQALTRDTAVGREIRQVLQCIERPVSYTHLDVYKRQEVIKMANDSDYGLGGAVWTQDINRAFRVANAIETGRVWVNTYNQIPEGSPFGGYKQSGIGRETHKVILEHYTQMKNILVNLSGQPSGFYSQK